MFAKVEEEQLSLKLWAIMRMRPELDEREHHESNRRYASILIDIEIFVTEGYLHLNILSFRC